MTHLDAAAASHHMTYLEAAVVGLGQGATELFPVSSNSRIVTPLMGSHLPATRDSPARNIRTAIIAAGGVMPIADVHFKDQGPERASTLA